MNNLAKTNRQAFNGLPSLIDEIFKTERIASSNISLKHPPVNIKESEKGFSIEMALPGYFKSDVNIEVENDLLKISSEKNSEDVIEGENYTKKEFHFKSFNRSFTLPEIVDIEKIDASFENGILTVLLPKNEELIKNKVKSITIK